MTMAGFENVAKIEHYPPFASPAGEENGGVFSITATPFGWPDPAKIPERAWLYGRWLLRGTMTAVIAPGGVGKSSFMAATAMALASGTAFLGKTIWGGPQRVWLWNLEDDGDELARQLSAAAIHHRLTAEHCQGRLFVDSGMDGAGLCTATETAEGVKINTPVIEALVSELLRREIDVLVIDPFVSSHQVEENANSKIDKIAKEWSRVAKRANCAVVLVHHTPKMGGEKVTAEKSRGAVALPYAARVALTLNRMTTDEAEQFGVSDDERRAYFAVQDDKHNRAPVEAADWFKLASTYLRNDPSGQWGDSVGVVESWTPPDAFDGINHTVLRAVYQAVSEGEWRDNWQSPDWVGHAIGNVIGEDASTPPGRKRILTLQKQWTGNLLAIEERPDAKRMTRKYVVPGTPPNNVAPPKPSEAVQGVAGVAHHAAPPPPPPCKGWGCGK
ncbi:AAA family ATPase [Pacificimonas sp. ICDLI1SI03]